MNLLKKLLVIAIVFSIVCINYVYAFSEIGNSTSTNTNTGSTNINTNTAFATSNTNTNSTSTSSNTNTNTNTYASVNVVPGQSTVPSSGIETELNSIETGGVKLSADFAYEGYPEAELQITVDNNDMENTLAGFEGELFFEGAYPTGEIISNTSGWRITSNIIRRNNSIKFIVEPEDLSNIAPKPQITIKYKFDFNVSKHIAYINRNTFKKTDIYNNVYTPLESQYPYDCAVALKITHTSPLTSVDPATAKVFEDKILTKFEAYLTENGQSVVVNPISLLYDTLSINAANWETLSIITDNDILTIANGGDFPLDRNLATSGNNIKLILTTSNLAGGETIYEYDVIQMGNVYYDDVVSATGAINVNDVMAFRQAVVGMDSIFNNPRFHIEASDVNFSNADDITLGDVGDIISIRQRILNYYWLDK